MNNVIRSPEELGAAIRRQRKSLSLSQKELGEEANLRPATISNLENGKTGVKLSTLFDVLAALKLEIDLSFRDKDKRDVEDVF